jgi:hypothetical protein
MIPSLAHAMNFDKGQAGAEQRGLAFEFLGVRHAQNVRSASGRVKGK